MEKLLVHGHMHGITLVAERLKLDEPSTSPAVALAAHPLQYFRRPASPFAGVERRANVLGAARFAEATW